MLGLDQRAFDQDLSGGWRAIGSRSGCTLVAADLIRDYRKAHPSKPKFLFWHEAQLRAQAGQTDAAIALFERAREPGADPTGWNPYADATVAFLRGDRPGLLRARARLLAVPRPADWNPSMKTPDGRTIAMPWPSNLNAVDGLIACFGRPYSEAYGPACTRPMFQVTIESPGK